MRYLILLCLFSLNAHAFTMSGELVGGKLTWSNSRKIGDEIVPDYWLKPPRLPATKKWVPGTYVSPTKLQLQLTNGTDTVSVPLDLTGVRYHPMKGYDKAPYSDIYPTCVKSDLGQFALVTTGATGGNFCIANSSINYEQPGPPFNQMQPSFVLKDELVAAALKGKSKGIYSGTVSAVTSYGFFAQGSETVKTYRNVAFTFSVQIKYSPSVINRINVLGNGHIVPKYDTTAHTVSGVSGFKVSALGYFENGLKFELINKAVDDYHLKPVTTGSTSIPYSITCQGCTTGSQLVEKGNVVSDGKAEIHAPGSSLIPFTLGVSYDNISVKDVEESSYADHFTIMFEVSL